MGLIMLVKNDFFRVRVRIMVFKPPFNNISVIKGL
jgi:hypothetical protein